MAHPVPARIIFVDDDNDWRFIVGASLRDAGYEVITVNDADEAMNHAEQGQFDLAIVELNLAQDGAVALMEYFKVNRPDLPIILYSGVSLDEVAIPTDMVERTSLYVLHKGSTEDLLEAVQAILS